MISLIGRSPLSKFSFSFLEVLIVVVIVGIIMGISLPRFRETYNSLQIKTSAHDLVQFFRFAQGEAIKNECVYKIVIDGHFYWLMFEKEEGNFEHAQGRWGNKNFINENIEITAEKQEIFFYPQGAIDRMEISLKRGEKVYTISTKERQGYVELVEK